MPQTITLNLPDMLYEPIRRTAQATNQPVETVLLTALKAYLPSLEGLPADLAQELVELEALDNDTLRQILLKTVPVEQQEELEALLHQNQASTLTETERKRLTYLQGVADRVMLHKAHAAVLLRFRGQRIPTLAELRQLTTTTQ